MLNFTELRDNYTTLLKITQIISKFVAMLLRYHRNSLILLFSGYIHCYELNNFAKYCLIITSEIYTFAMVEYSWNILKK